MKRCKFFPTNCQLYPHSLIRDENHELREEDPLSLYIYIYRDSMLYRELVVA